jgi:biotin carboxyl carrier protein
MTQAPQKTSDNSTANRKVAPLHPHQASSSAPARSTPAAAPPLSETENSAPRPYIWWLSLLLGVGVVSHIPVSNNLKVDATLDLHPDRHRIVHMQVPGTITEFAVERGDFVREGQTIAIVSTDGLDGQVNDSRASYEGAHAEYESYLSQAQTLQEEVREAEQRGAAIQRQLLDTQAKLDRMQGGVAPAAIQTHQAEIDGIGYQIAGLRDERVSQQEQLGIVREQIARVTELHDEGGISKAFLEDLQVQSIQIEGQISAIDADIARHEAEILKKKAEIATAAEGIVEERDKLYDELTVAGQSLQTALSREQAAYRQAENTLPQVRTYQSEFERQQGRQAQNQTLRSQLEGIVITSELNTKIGRHFGEGEAILEVAQTDTIQARLEVPQADTDVLIEGAEVTFHPLEPGMEKYTATIESVDTVMEADPTGQKKLRVTYASIPNPAQTLVPGSQVYATVEAESIPLYAKVYRELMKVLNLRRHF